MSDQNDVTDKLRIPFGYNEIAVKVQDNLNKNFSQRLSEYTNFKNSVTLGDIPKFNTLERITSDEFSIQNTSYFKQAEYLGNLAQNAIDEVKPFLFSLCRNLSLWFLPKYSFSIYKIQWTWIRDQMGK